MFITTYNNSSIDTIVIWVPKGGISLNNLPIKVSGAGATQFVNWDRAEPSMQNKPTMSNFRRIYKPVALSGTLTLTPQSQALNQIRDLLNQGEALGIPVMGTMKITNIGAQQEDTLNDCFFTSSIALADRNTQLSDVVVSFSFSRPQSLNAGLTTQILNLF